MILAERIITLGDKIKDEKIRYVLRYMLYHLVLSSDKYEYLIGKELKQVGVERILPQKRLEYFSLGKAFEIQKDRIKNSERE